jgi:hypothetical protein
MNDNPRSDLVIDALLMAVMKVGTMKTDNAKRMVASLFAGLAYGALAVMPCTAVAEESAKTPSAAYLEQVVSVLRSHVISMRMILDHDDMKYADNMVRHAEAFERAFGMVGPMEWHVAEAFQYVQDKDATEKLTKQRFEELAENSRKAISRIKRSAKRYMRDKNKQLMHESIDNMIKSCDSCHSKLPAGTVPHVWMGMNK